MALQNHMIEGFYEWELLIACHHSAKISGHRYCGSGDIMILAYCDKSDIMLFVCHWSRKTTLLKDYMTKLIEGADVKSPPFQTWWPQA